MLCPECQCEAIISAVRKDAVLSGEEIQVFAVQEFSCRNAKCRMHGKKIGEKKAEVYRGIPKKEEQA